MTEIKDRELLKVVYMTNPQDDVIGKHSFTPVKVIGKGGYSRVLMVRTKATGDIFAMKTISKQFIEMKGKVQQIYTELEVLTKV